MNGTNLIGAETEIDQLIRRYFPGRSQSFLYQLAENEEAVLLACLLLELRGEVAEGSTDDTTGDYHSEELTLGDNSTETVELEWAPDRWDLRFDDDIVVRFTDESKPNVDIDYAKEESPVTGIPVRTSVVELEKADSADKDPVVSVQGWQG